MKLQLAFLIMDSHGLPHHLEDDGGRPAKQQHTALVDESLAVPV
jgi:protoheme ferro-lyase